MAESVQNSIKVRDTLVAVGIGILLFLTTQTLSYFIEEEIQDFKIKCLQLPFSLISRLLGWLADLHLPKFSRKLILGTFVETFGVNLTEALESDLEKYTSLGELFQRSLKPNIRKIHSADVVSPADGTVLRNGRLNKDQIEEIKGVDYSLETFFGRPSPGVNYRNLYHSIIYLAPGDYHSFHSSAEWNVTLRRHLHGQLYPVIPSTEAWNKNVFNMNERTLYSGHWEHGLFSMTAVGTTGVGSINVFFDKDLKTNIGMTTKIGFNEKEFENHVSLSKGAKFGTFTLGSTVIVIFEAPEGTTVCVEPGQKVKVGQALFTIPK